MHPDDPTEETGNSEKPDLQSTDHHFGESGVTKLAKFHLSLTLGLLISLCVGVIYAWGPVTQYRNTDPTLDGFVQPRSISDLIDSVQQSTVSIYCEFGPDGEYELGTGWALDIETDREIDYPTALITNHHVIENCLNAKGRIFVEAFGGEKFPALIDNWDIKNDLAVVVTKLKVKPLTLSPNNPSPGYWVMAIGTADGYEGSVSFGNVLNITDTEVLITAAISSGNSGGPLVDNEGKVIGTNSWSAAKEQYNGAMSLDAMCRAIMQCDGDTYWKWD